MPETDVDTQELENKVMSILSNDPSDPVYLQEYDVYLVFQRPSFKDKYKARAWALKKLKEFGYDDANAEDPELSYFFRSWGTVNSHVRKVLYFDEKGSHKLQGKTYSEYEYTPEKDLDYSSVFEKYAIEVIYGAGEPEDVFVASAIIAYTRWVEHFSLDGDDIKNS